MEFSKTITWYEKNAPEAPHFATLATDLDVDVCVLGSGVVGISTALHLAEAGQRVVVLEPSRIGFGSGGRAGGVLDSGLHVSLDDLSDVVGHLSAHKFWQSSVDARNLLVKRIRENKIKCELNMGLFKLSNKKSLKDHMQHNAFYYANNFDNEVISYVNERMLRNMGISGLVTGMRVAESGRFNPLSFLYGMVELAEDAGVKIYEKTPIESYKKAKDAIEVNLGHCKVTARKIIVCGNAFMGHANSPEKTKTVSTEFFQLVTEPLDAELMNVIFPKGEAMADMARLQSYIHPTVDHRLVIGGPVKSFIKNNDKYAQYILNKVSKTLPKFTGHLTPAYLWKGPVGVPMNYMPVFQKLDKNVYTAHGFNGHGVSLAYMAGSVLADACTGDDEMFELFGKIQQIKMPQALQHLLAKFGLFFSKFENRIF